MKDDHENPTMEAVLVQLKASSQLSTEGMYS